MTLEIIDKIIVLKEKLVNIITKKIEKPVKLIRIDRTISNNKMIDLYIYKEV